VNASVEAELVTVNCALNTAQSFVPETVYGPANKFGITKFTVFAVGYAAAVGELDANPVAVTPPTWIRPGVAAVAPKYVAVTVVPTGPEAGDRIQ